MEDNAVQRPGAKVGVTIMTRVCPSIGSLAIAGMVAVAFAAAPVGLDYNFTLEIESAFAKGKGSGGKGGSKGSKGSKSSKSGGHGKSGDGNGLEEAGGKNGNAFGHEKARGNGHHKGHHADADENGDGVKKTALGNLNAAHASPNAREHAAANSMVGLLAAYAEQADQMTADEARAALGAISNKSSFEQSFNEGAGADVVDAEVVDEVNALLDVENKPVADEEVE